MAGSGMSIGEQMARMARSGAPGAGKLQHFMIYRSFVLGLTFGSGISFGLSFGLSFSVVQCCIECTVLNHCHCVTFTSDLVCCAECTVLLPCHWVTFTPVLACGLKGTVLLQRHCVTFHSGSGFWSTELSKIFVLLFGASLSESGRVS